MPASRLVQSLLLAPYHMNASGPLRAVAGLHVLNALLVFWVVLRLLERTSARQLPGPGGRDGHGRRAASG